MKLVTVTVPDAQKAALGDAVSKSKARVGESWFVRRAIDRYISSGGLSLDVRQLSDLNDHGTEPTPEVREALRQYLEREETAPCPTDRSA